MLLTQQRLYIRFIIKNKFMILTKYRNRKQISLIFHIAKKCSNIKSHCSCLFFCGKKWIISKEQLQRISKLYFQNSS
jgi:hypothetical protein